MKRLFNKNKSGFEPTPFTTEPPAHPPVPAQRSGRSESLPASQQRDEQPGSGHARGYGSQGSFPTHVQTQGHHAVSGSRSASPYVASAQQAGAHSSRQSPDPQYTLEGVKAPQNQQHQQQQYQVSNQGHGHNPGLSASASAKKWFAGLNGKGSGYDQITPFTMPDQPPNQQKSSTSVDRHSWHELAGPKPPAKQASKYAGVDGSLGHPTGRHVAPQATHEGLVPPPAEQGAANVKRRVSLRDHANGRMFGWTSRDKHKEKDKKVADGGNGGGSLQPGLMAGPKVISGMRYEDTAYPSIGQPVPVAKDGSTVYAGRGYGVVHNPNSVSMSRATTQSADYAAERRGSSGSISGQRQEYQQYPQDALLSPSGGHLPRPLPLSQQHSRSSQQSARLYSGSPGAFMPEHDQLQRPISMVKLNSDQWSPASSEHELLVPRDNSGGNHGSRSPGPGPLPPKQAIPGRDAYSPLGTPPPILVESQRPASPLQQRTDAPVSRAADDGRHSANHDYSMQDRPQPIYPPSGEQHGDPHWSDNHGHELSAEDRKHHKKKGFFGLAGIAGKDKGPEKDKQSDWAGFLRKKEPRIEYRGPEYTDHTTITDASYSEVMPAAYAGGDQHVKVMEMAKKDKEQAIRDAQERTKEALKAERARAKEEEKRIKEEERRLREEQRERAKAAKGLDKREKEEGKFGKSAPDVKSVSFEIDELCRTALASDLSKIYNIGDRLSRCDKSVHKEAVHATRKQIKHGETPEAKIFALKIWLLISDFDRSDSGFRVISFEKKFLSAIEDQLLNRDGDSGLPRSAHERMRDTLSHLCYHYGRLPGGETLRHSWQKVKRADEPQDGYSFPETHPVFSPQDPLLRKPVQAKSASEDLQHLNTILPDEVQQLSRLVEECQTAKKQARALQEALLLDGRWTMKAEMNKRYAECVHTQEELESQMNWANTQAEKSRLERGLSTPADFGMSFEDQLNGLHVDPKSGRDDLPLAERAFGDLLAACDELTNVIKLYEDAERASREHRELRYVQEKSKNETRMGRSSNEGGLSVPQAYDSLSGTLPSRSSSPSKTSDANHYNNASDYHHGLSRTGAHSPYSYGTPLSRTPTTAESVDMPPPRFPGDGRAESPPRNGARLQGPRPFRERGKFGSSSSLQSSQHLHSSSPKNNFVVRNGTDEDEDEDLSRPPARPSAKALGKRREIPKETSTFDPDDIWKLDEPKQPDSPAESDTSFEDWLLRKPEKYVYDAMQDKEVQRQLEEMRKKKADSTRRKTLESGYGGSQYISSGVNAQLAEIKKALGNEAPSRSPAASRGSSRAASPVQENPGMHRTHSSRWRWRK